MRTLALMMCLLMTVPTLAGCFTEETKQIDENDEWWELQSMKEKIWN